MEMVWTADRFKRVYWVCHLSLVGNAFGVPYALGQHSLYSRISIILLTEVGKMTTSYLRHIPPPSTQQVDDIASDLRSRILASVDAHLCLLTLLLWSVYYQSP
jgi:hypothetical protein